MKQKLFSVVVPTKDREQYLLSLIKLFISFQNEDMELVIQDNTVDNSSVTAFLQNQEPKNIIYNYIPDNLTVVENSDLAIKASSGKYVCFLGDDDLLSERSYSFVKMMDEEGIDSAIFNVAKYYWPGTKFVAHEFPNLIIYNSKPSMYKIDVDKEFNYLLEHGAYTLRYMPKVYHGIVKRSVLDQVYEKTGTYFPGPSPDMANSVALAQFVTKHIYCDIPVISSGTSPKSTAGLGSEHKHEGELKKKAFLPSNIEERWDSNIPKVWTGPTIYAQSALEAIRALSISEAEDKFNYNYHYAAFISFCPEYRKMFFIQKKQFKKCNYIGLTIALLSIFFLRAHRFIKNIILSRFGKGATIYNGVSDTIIAEQYIDEKIKDYDFVKLIKEK